MKVKMQVVSCESKDEALDKASDETRKIAHHIAMYKKSIVLSGLVTAEDFDTAFKRELDKEWDKIKDLDEEGYMLKVLADMLTKGMSLKEIFGKEEE